MNKQPSPRRFRRWLAVALAAVVLAMGVGLARRMRADLPIEQLRARWATGASRFISVDGMDVHYRDEGAGPAVVLLHGTSASLHTWDGWAGALSRDHRVVRFDLPAFGLTGPSPTRDYSIAAYVRFVDHVTLALGLERFAIAGNSLGGDIAWHYALDHAARVSALVLVDAAGYSWSSSSSSSAAVPWAFRIARWPIVPALLTRLDPQPFVRDGLRKSYGDPARIRPGVLDRYVELSLRPGNRQAFVDRMRTAAVDDGGRLRDIRTPTLILWGGRDRVIDPGNARRFASDIHGSRLALYDDLGHIPMEEDPERTVRDTAAFLAGTW